MAGFFSAAPFRLLLPLFSLLFISTPTPSISVKGVSLGTPVVNITPSLRVHSSVIGSKDFLLCDRVNISGLPRLKIGSYASAFRVNLALSTAIPERLHSRIHICSHRNASLGHCQCEKDDWKTVQRGVWRSVMSPYGDKFVDVKVIGDIPGPITVTLEEEYQAWRLVLLALGVALLLFAPIVSRWVPFYYSSSMAVGIFLVILILIFQLLPMGRKNLFYVTVYGSILGAGSFLLHQFSLLVNSILVNFGLSEEMHNPVAIFLLVAIVLAGAALGYWIVRKYVISKDGSVDAGVAQFVKWAMRIVATTFIFQSTLDTLLATVVLAAAWAISSLLTSSMLHDHIWSSQPRKAATKQNGAEFLSRSSRMKTSGKWWSSPSCPPAFLNSPVKGVISPPTGAGSGTSTIDKRDYYSTFHKMRKSKKFTKRQWEDFTRQSTQGAVADLAASPEFTDWIINHADRIQLISGDSSDESVGSHSGKTTDDDEVGSYRPFRLLNW